MAVVKAFAAVRPRPDLASRIAALPYDVYNTEEARTVLEKEPLSFLGIDRAEAQFDPERNMDPYSPEVYEKAHDTLWGMIARGEFVSDEQPAYYIYRLTMKGRSQTGIVGCSSVEDYEKNVILKHENTLREKEQDRIVHIDTLNAQTGPIFLAYPRHEGLADIVARETAKEPLYDFTSDDGIRHAVWKIGDIDRVIAIREAFLEIPHTYIADGHHRAASAVRVAEERRKANKRHTGREEYNYFLSVLFPDDELLIMDYNRVVKDLNGLSEREFLAKIAADFPVESVEADPVKPDKKGIIGMYLGGKWYRLAISDKIKSADPVKGLDVSILQDHLLTPVLGIGDPKTDKRIAFVGGIRGLSELERRVQTDMKIAFAMYPTSIAELFATADAGLLMPPKSTWFEPKLRSGLFIHNI
ncbi:MAG: DUF1015 family protein [Fusobacteriaceae bacterium]|jgi:uncharacterized protein (DUF1015 family)|nr:DUF1015 family protein [Fusobacteriaceae bacterium]